MKINEFNEKTLPLLLDKEPRICFVSQSGAQGPSGLMFAIFNDDSLYYLNINKRKDIISILKTIKAYIPGMPINIKCDLKRDRKEIALRYLGGGNSSTFNFLEEDQYLKFCKKNKSRFEYSKFKDYLSLYYGLNINDIYFLSLRKKEIETSNQ